MQPSVQMLRINLFHNTFYSSYKYGTHVFKKQVIKINQINSWIFHSKTKFINMLFYYCHFKNFFHLPNCSFKPIACM